MIHRFLGWLLCVVLVLGAIALAWAQSEEQPAQRERRRGRRAEWLHKKSGQRFLSPKDWDWHEGPNHSTIDRVCYPPSARAYLPCAILRVKELDEGVTFPMIVDYAWFKINKMVKGQDKDDEEAAEEDDRGDTPLALAGDYKNARKFKGKIVRNEAIELPFENDGAHLIHVKGSLRGIDVEDYEVIFLRGDWWTIVAFGCREGTLGEHMAEFEEMIEGITFEDAGD